MTSVPTKVCGDCKLPKPLEAFGRSRGEKDGLTWSCKVCRHAYERNLRHGVSREAINKSPEGIARRFWAKVDKSDDTGCWVWTGANFLGYGRFMLNQKPVLAHRFAYELTNGPIPNGLCLCHHCDNPPCVRPDHMFVGTRRDNMQDCAVKGRSGQAKLTAAQAAEIRKRYAAGERGNALAKVFGLSTSSVSSLIRRKTWRHVA